jgi:hypothetical protein
MTQSQLDREVAAATGETLSTIRRRGFSVVDAPCVHARKRPRQPRIVDWDALHANRTALLPGRGQRRTNA